MTHVSALFPDLDVLLTLGLLIDLAAYRHFADGLVHDPARSGWGQALAASLVSLMTGAVAVAFMVTTESVGAGVVVALATQVVAVGLLYGSFGVGLGLVLLTHLVGLLLGLTMIVHPAVPAVLTGLWLLRLVARDREPRRPRWA